VSESAGRVCGTLVTGIALPFIGESSHPPGMFHLRHKDYSVDDLRQPISHWT